MAKLKEIRCLNTAADGCPCNSWMLNIEDQVEVRIRVRCRRIGCGYYEIQQDKAGNIHMLKLLNEKEHIAPDDSIRVIEA